MCPESSIGGIGRQGEIQPIGNPVESQCANQPLHFAMAGATMMAYRNPTGAGCMQKHFVEFYSPGTLVSESTTREIAEWDIDAARAMSAGIVERHGSHPYAFRFITRSRESGDLDSRISAKSPLYFLSGVVETYDEVVKRDSPNERILRSNMEVNGYKRVITCKTPWRITLPFGDDDVLLSSEDAACDA